ncbi:unnamed protein product [Caretta caretta]
MSASLQHLLRVLLLSSATLLLSTAAAYLCRRRDFSGTEDHQNRHSRPAKDTKLCAVCHLDSDGEVAFPHSSFTLFYDPDENEENDCLEDSLNMTSVAK